MEPLRGVGRVDTGAISPELCGFVEPGFAGCFSPATVNVSAVQHVTLTKTLLITSSDVTAATSSRPGGGIQPPVRDLKRLFAFGPGSAPPIEILAEDLPQPAKAESESDSSAVSNLIRSKNGK